MSLSFSASAFSPSLIFVRPFIHPPTNFAYTHPHSAHQLELPQRDSPRDQSRRRRHVLHVQPRQLHAQPDADKPELGRLQNVPGRTIRGLAGLCVFDDGCDGIEMIRGKCESV